MELPEDLNSLLRHVRDDARSPRLNEEDEAFIDKVIKGVRDGNKALMIGFNPTNDRLQYIVINGNKCDGVFMVAKVLERLSQLD